jgi:hypothetical protein
LCKEPLFGNIVQLLCNENFNRYRADVGPSGALTMERLADLQSSDVPPGNGQTRQHKRAYQGLGLFAEEITPKCTWVATIRR